MAAPTKRSEEEERPLNKCGYCGERFAWRSVNPLDVTPELANILGGGERDTCCSWRCAREIVLCFLPIERTDEHAIVCRRFAPYLQP